MTKFLAFAALAAFVVSVHAGPPRLVKQGSTHNLLVHDKPYLILGGEPWTPRDKQTIADHGGMLIWAGGEEFWFAGQGITITYKGADNGPPLVGLDIVEEGVFDANGKWIAGRRLNGDQTHQGRHVRLPPGNPQIQKVRFYRYR